MARLGLLGERRRDKGTSGADPPVRRLAYRSRLRDGVQLKDGEDGYGGVVWELGWLIETWHDWEDCPYPLDTFS